VRVELKGALVGASCAAATASAWAQLVASMGARLNEDDNGSELAAGIWVAAMLAGMPLAVMVGRRAGDIAGRVARYRAPTLFAIAGVTAVRALSCALLGALVLERWARPTEDVPTARTIFTPSDPPASD
jgi:hypothetical protein